MLGGLERDGDPGKLAELARPHPGAVDDELGLDVAVRCADPGHGAVPDQDARDGHALDDASALLTRAPGERHRDVDRIHPAVSRDVEACQYIIRAGQRPQLGDLFRRDLVHLDATVPVERRYAAVLLQAPRLDGQLDEPDLAHPGGQAGLGL